ncbi:MAG: response regulator transcription factor [bacterium]|nr:response regulator transcription factor [bacterium]
MRILLVEDERKLARAIKKGLEQESYAVDVAFDGDEGLLEAQNEDYDIIILDRMMPGDVDGSGILKKLRAAGDNTPIMFLTAKDHIEDRVEGLNMGADDYLIKPFSFDELVARVKALLRRPKKSLSIKLLFDDLLLNSTNYEVKRGKKNIQLSNKEFALLEFLMRDPGVIQSKEKIRDHVWNFDANILPNTIEATIKGLRAKIDKPFRKKLIITIRGFGYKLGEKT